MYKMLLVDDQMKEINGIKGLLDWKQMQIEIIGHANNGKDGLEMALRLKPDLIVTDVVMPLMDGLEMIDRLKELQPDVKVVFISCFDEFKFASKAINQGAYGYVLKPILPKELMNAVNKVLGVCEEEKKRQNEFLMLRQKVNENLLILKEQYYKNLLYGAFKDSGEIIEQGKFLGINIENKNFSAASIEFENTNDSHDDDVYLHIVTVMEKLKFTFNQYHDIAFLLMDLNHISILLMDEKREKQQSKKYFISILEEILNYINTEFDVSATGGVGEVVDLPEKITQSNKHSKNALQYKFYLGKMCVIDWEEISLESGEHVVQIDRMNDILKKSILSGDKQLITSFIDEMLNSLYSPNVLKYISYTILNTVQIILLQMQQGYQEILGPYQAIIEKVSNIDSLENLKKWLTAKILDVIEQLQSSSKIENAELGKKMEQYIKKHYQEPIMIQDIAEHIYLSPGYAGFIFKNLTGKTIHQYIEDLRMKKAAELILQQGDKKVYEIAQCVGFENSGYFINVFKKTYGCTPAEYKKRRVIHDQ